MTEVELKAYLERIITEIDRRLSERITVMDDACGVQLKALEDKITILNETGWRAIEKSDQSVNERLAAMNEWRQQLHDERNEFATRELVEELRKRVDASATQELAEILRTRLDQAATKVELEAMVKARETRFQQGELRTTKIEEWKNNMEGRQAVRQWLWPILVGVMVFILTQIMRFLFPVGHLP